MTEHMFEVRREMVGDKEYATGDTRKLSALDAIQLVKSGALKPKGEAAEKAMAELMKETPEDRSGIVQAVKTDAPRNKDAGDAPANKTRKGAAGGKAKSGASGGASGPATGTGSGDNAAAAGGGTPATPAPTPTPTPAPTPSAPAQTKRR